MLLLLVVVPLLDEDVAVAGFVSAAAAYQHLPTELIHLTKQRRTPEVTTNFVDDFASTPVRTNAERVRPNGRLLAQPGVGSANPQMYTLLPILDIVDARAGRAVYQTGFLACRRSPVFA